MRSPFKLKVKKKRLYAPGVLVIGNIISGDISCDEIVCVRIDSKKYEARVDAINNDYPDGNNVYSCENGSDVGLYLSKVDYTTIKIGKTIIERVDTDDECIIDTPQKAAKKGKRITGKKKSKEELDRPKSSRMVLKHSSKVDDEYLNIVEQVSLIAEKDQKSKEEKFINNSISHSVKQSHHSASGAITTSPLDATQDKKKSIVSPNIKSSLYTNSKEKEFVEDIKVCLKDGGRISPSEFFVLDKIRKALSIPQERAKELISAVSKDYKDKRNEIEYSDAVSLCLMDSNYISDTERFLLEKLRLSLNISQHRAYEIEESCKWILTE